MFRFRECFLCVVLLAGAFSSQVWAGKLRVAVVQTVIENTLEQNQAKLLRFVDRAKDKRCRLVIFPECSLYWHDIAVDEPARADLDAAIALMGRRAQETGLYVVFGTSYRLSEGGKWEIRGVVFDPNGARPVFYEKNLEVPRRFVMDGVPCNLSICSDRGYLEHSDLPCLVQNSQLIIDISGGHGGDDGRPDLRWIRYRPWALRTGAYVIVSNPVHADTDFMGHSPWGGGSAVVRPDGSIQARFVHEKDVMLVEEIDSDLATRAPALRRRSHPAFKSFWDMGKALLEGAPAGPVPQVTPYASARRPIKIAAVQMACSRDLDQNVEAILRHVAAAAAERADVAVFPELAVTGSLRDDILAAAPAALDAAVDRIRDAARRHRVYVIFGMPVPDGGCRRNCAVVVGNTGEVETRYVQLAADGDVFTPGADPKSMWFRVKGVPAIVTVGADSDWVEIADLAANRGMVLHFHISYEADASPEASALRVQRNLLMMTYAAYGTAVNAGDPGRLANPSAPAGGRTVIVSREGGHGKPAPAGLEYYLPYQTSIVESAAENEEILYAVRETPARNDMNLATFWRNRNRKARSQAGWHAWLRMGASLVEARSEGPGD